MTYLAPRQGLFAIIILVSFCLHTLLLVVSTEQQLSDSREHKARQMTTQLSREIALALASQDRVSLSVIANRYASEDEVTRLSIYAPDETVLVQTGATPLQQGSKLKQAVTVDDAVIGHIALTLKDTSKGEVIAMQWPFVLGSLIFHLFVWLLYGYVARPTKAQLMALTREVQQHYRLSETASKPVRQRSDRPIEPSLAAVVDYLKSPQHRSTVSAGSAAAWSTATTSQQTDSGSEHDVNDPTEQRSDDGLEQTGYDGRGHRVDSHVSKEYAHSTNPSPATAQTQDQSRDWGKLSMHNLSHTRPYDTLCVQLQHADGFNLIDRVTPQMSAPYFTLSTQLLQRACEQVLQQPLLYGVSVVGDPVVDSSGSQVLLHADNDHAKVALAAAMLARLYVMLNQFIYDKHVELSLFALKVKVGVSDTAQTQPMKQLLVQHGKEQDIFLLLPKPALKQIANHMQLHNLSKPTSVYERECAVFSGSDEQTVQRLVAMRDAVLLSGEMPST